MRARPMRMRFLVGSDGKLRDVARHRALRHIETDMPATRASLLRRDQRQVDHIGHEIRGQQKSLRFGLGTEIVRLASEAVFEIVLCIEDEIRVVIKVHNRRRIGYGYVADGLLTGAVEVLMPAIERNG